MKTLPTFTCETCSFCETDFHNDQRDAKRLGFCLKFKENTGLTEKNVSCWTDQKNEYYENLVKLRQHQISKKHFVNEKKKKDLQLTFNQLSFF